MIVYLQQIKLFGKFCFYGCYCFAKGPRNLLVPGGNSAPMDGADSACKRHLVIWARILTRLLSSGRFEDMKKACKKNLNSSIIKQCNECSKMDFGETCSATDPYNFVAKQDDVTGIAWIQVKINKFYFNYSMISASTKKAHADELFANATKRWPTIYLTPSVSGTFSTTRSGATSILTWTASELAAVDPKEASDSTSHLLQNAADNTQGTAFLR